MADYAWKKGSRQKVSAQIAGEMCERLAAEEGGLTAKRLVDANRPEDAPLHDEFEWNNREAAEKWREQQARVLIASLITVSPISEAKEPVRAFFNISYTEAEYESLEVIIQSEDKHRALLDRALREMEAYRAKYQALQELAPLFKAIDEIAV